MIEQALYSHLISQSGLTGFLATYSSVPAVFNQKAPPDTDEGWIGAPQYPRLVFAVDLLGDPARVMGGALAVDIQCPEDGTPPETLEPVVRALIHGWFFSGSGAVAAAQWKDSRYFTEPTEQVVGCTLSFDLLAFPVLTTAEPDVIDRLNEWTAAKDGLYVINHDALPSSAWKPQATESAVYWRLVQDAPAGWIPDTFQTIWRTAIVRGHIFSQDNRTAAKVARQLVTGLYADKRLFKTGEAPVMVNRRNSADLTADPLRTGQLTVEATYGVIVWTAPDGVFNHINVDSAPVQTYLEDEEQRVLLDAAGDTV